MESIHYSEANEPHWEKKWWMSKLQDVGVPMKLLCNLPILKVKIDGMPWCRKKDRRLLMKGVCGE